MLCKVVLKCVRLMARNASLFLTWVHGFLVKHQVLPRMRNLLAQKKLRYYGGVGVLVFLLLMIWIGPGDDPAKVNADLRRKQIWSEFEAPDIVPVEADSGMDSVEHAFATAKASYEESLLALRDRLSVDMVQRFEKLRQQMDGPDAANRSFEDLKAEFDQFNQPVAGRTHRGWLPRSHLVKDLREAYWRAVDRAADLLGAEASRLLAEYEKEGVTTTARINPLKAAVMAADHKHLIGTWRSDYDRFGRYSVWVVSLDDKSASWKIDGTLDADNGSSAGILQSGQEILLKDKALNFQMCTVSSETRKVKPGGIKALLSVSGDMLLLEAWENGKKVRMEPLHRSGDEAAKEMVEKWAALPSDSLVDAKVDLQDPVAVWRELAELASFGAGRQGQEELFIPTRSAVFRPSTGFMPLITGVADSDYYIRRMNEELGRYRALLIADSPYLRRAAAELMELSIARMELSQANETHGNTATSVLVQGQEDVLLPAINTYLSYQMDRADARAELRQEFPGQSVEPGLVMMSDTTLGQLRQTFQGVYGLPSKEERRAQMSALLSYDDMHQSDLAAELWETWLMPLVRKTYSKVSPKELVSFDTEWSPPESDHEGGGHHGRRLVIRNVTKQKLTNLVLAVHVENEWGDSGMHYYFLREMGVLKSLPLEFNHRLFKRSLRCTNKVLIKASAWCDQGRMTDLCVACRNPKPHADAAALHRRYAEYDVKYEESGLQVGAFMRCLNFLRLEPSIQVPRLRELLSPEVRYTMKTGKDANPCLVRFVKLQDGPNMLAVEILDAGGSPHFRDGTLIKGEIKASPEHGAILDCEGNLRVVLKGAGPLAMIQYKDDATELWRSPLQRVYGK